ncbi:MAG: EamA/RhaT family transporter, partial [Rhodobacter sp.]|nr:EamA/RhaT family transporter [Rhodobacter sp.]
MDFRAIAMGLAFSAMWSSAFTSARMIVMDAPPLTALAIRF